MLVGTAAYCLMTVVIALHHDPVVVAFLALPPVAVALSFASAARDLLDTRAALRADPKGQQARDVALRGALQNLPIVLWTTDASLNVTAASGHLGDAGGDLRSMIGRDVVRALGVTDEIHEQQLLMATAGALRGEPSAFSLEAGGRWFDAYIDTVRASDDTPVGTVAVAVDRTDVARAREELDDLASRSRELTTLRKTFLQTVSHELRTPLTSVRGFAATLIRHGETLTTDQRALIAERLLANAERLGRLLSDLLDVDRLLRGAVHARRQPTEVAPLIRRVVEQIETRGQKVVMRLEEVTANLDGPRVERIVENLLANAVKYTPSTTLLEVSLARRREIVRITVAQHGSPIPEGARHELFEPFRQGREALHAAQPGVGIGLSLVAEFARLHDGKAWVEDVPDGAAFHVELLDGPVSAQHAEDLFEPLEAVAPREVTTHDDVEDVSLTA